MRARGWLLAVGVLPAFLASTTAAESETDPARWLDARPGYEWEFPRDHWTRPGYRTEWWYFTGHLRSSSGRRFGYQFTFFRVGLLPSPPELNSDWAAGDLIMGHAALSDLTQGDHRFSELVYRASPLLGGFGSYPDTVLAWSQGPAGTQESWRLRWLGDGFALSMADAENRFALRLTATAMKPLVFQGPNGFSRKARAASGAPVSASQYYSFTRLATSGSIAIDVDTLEVSGESWMDKEFGSGMLAADQVGWDWFSLQLDDGSETMIYLLRRQDGGVSYGSATLVAADGGVIHLELSEFAVTATTTWTSPHTAATYPAGWTIEVAGRRWEVRPVTPDQENRSERIAGMFYWEGAVEVLDRAGRRAGRGYVELTGYGEGRMPGL